VLFTSNSKVKNYASYLNEYVFNFKLILLIDVRFYWFGYHKVGIKQKFNLVDYTRESHSLNTTKPRKTIIKCDKMIIV